MSNMPYCRFQNTKNDLADCEDVLLDLADGIKHEISEDEIDAAVRLIVRCKTIAELFLDCPGRREVLNKLKQMIADARFCEGE